VPQHSKLQRWTDLIAALLAHTFPITFEDLAREVPAYAAGLDPEHKDSVKRTFERDKDELKDFGVPIEVIAIDEGENTGYALKAKRFYLPYLSLSGAEEPATPKPSGYRALPTVSFDPDELHSLAQASQRLEQLGDPLLADHARSARGKFLFDLSAFQLPATDVHVLGADDGTTAETFELLTGALRNRKTVTFRYSAPSSDATTERRVDTYGLFFIYAHWYLAAFDRTRDGIRNFRLSRMSDVKVNKKQPQTHDYTVPPEFRLRDHAQSRAAWDLGDAEQQTAEVRFTGASGAVQAAMRDGEGVNGSSDVRRFAVRRNDVFALWLMSFAGEAVPLSPPALVSTYRQLVGETLARYRSADSSLRSE
jgi:proteasome accessory factor B